MTRAYSILRLLRPYQWTKNLLLFLPLLLAHRVADRDLLLQSVLGFLAFSLSASATYIVNDLLDVEADRRHPLKKKRPLAAGLVSPKLGMGLVPLLFSGGLAISYSWMPAFFLRSIFLYVAVSLAYSFYLKRFPIIDVFILAALYTLRLMAGGLATDIPLSPWLLAFSMFFFTHLAIVKRFAELQGQLTDQGPVMGRNYTASDQAFLGSIGPICGYLSVLVFILYLNGSQEVSHLYQHPMTLWLIAPFLLYWITYVWLLAHRRQMHDDPIAFALKDPVSYAIGIIIVMIAFVATR